MLTAANFQKFVKGNLRKNTKTPQFCAQTPREPAQVGNSGMALLALADTIIRDVGGIVNSYGGISTKLLWGAITKAPPGLPKGAKSSIPPKILGALIFTLAI